MLSSAALTLLAWTWWKRSGARQKGACAFVAVGMTFGLIGDLLLANLVVSGKAALLLGMGAFGIGHLAYLGALVREQRSRSLGWDTFLIANWVAWLGVGAFGWYAIVAGAVGIEPLIRDAALVYVALLASLPGLALPTAARVPELKLMGIGSAIFFLSDLVLSMRLFRPELFERIPDAIRGDAVWLSYGVAQALIVAAAGTLARQASADDSAARAVEGLRTPSTKAV